ncbi:MAG: DUF2961 domain-containing protein [Pirellulales bacterium]|nr:DUF2961 domain-containing protein [Pirellulales bacterium]
MSHYLGAAPFRWIPWGLALVFAALNASPARAGSPCDCPTLDDLPVLPRNVRLLQFSSHNKQGINGDAEWPLYEDDRGDAVVFDAAGPGCVRSIWQTCIPGGQSLKFYFDGEAEPRFEIPALDFHGGKHPLFPKPLVSCENLGYYAGGDNAGNCFVPIPFAKSLKVSVTGQCSFNHFLYELYPRGTPVTTFTGKEDRSYLLRAFAEQGEELSPPADATATRVEAVELKPGQAWDVLQASEPATVSRIVIEGPASEEFLRQVEIEMWWDDAPRPDVLAPMGMFFACPLRPENVRSLPAKVEVLPEGRIRLTSYFRMPFWRSARIALVSRAAGAKPLGPVSAEIQLVPQRYAETDTGYFTALYRDGRTEMARDWLILDALGTGRFLGLVQTMEGGHYCEGNERFAADGAGMPRIHGTGSEDYYLACLWPNPNFNKPFAGCVGDITKKPGPACYYRFHLEAAMPFYSALDARIQHGGMSDIVSHYRSLGFAYLRRTPVLFQTDFIDVANGTSEREHDYQAADSTLTEELTASYEGNHAGVLVRDRGRVHAGGEITFTVAVDPDNAGVRLRRRLDQKSPRQAADVFVDGQPAGTWYHADQNEFLRWHDAEIDLPPELTRGKSELTIRLAIKSGGGHGPFTDYRYEALSYRFGGDAAVGSREGASRQ